MPFACWRVSGFFRYKAYCCMFRVSAPASGVAGKTSGDWALEAFRV